MLTSSRRWSRAQLLWCAGLSLLPCVIAACASEADLPRFNDVQSAPPAIRNSARAVVRVRTAGEQATAWFASPSGLMVTNNHVLGETVCPLEGCAVSVNEMYQRGERVTPALTLYAVPIAIDAGLDLAVVQLSYEPGGTPFASPDYLTIDPQDGASLIGHHVTVVGHPEGHLKKWTDGVVTDLSGDWMTETAFALPGDSGSPILEDDGRVVGLVHRAPATEDLIAAHDVNVYSIGTPAALLAAAMAAPLPSGVVSVKAPLTEAQLVQEDLVFLNANTRAATILAADGTVSPETDVLGALGRACDLGLARVDYTSIEDLGSALLPCAHAALWIDCRADRSATPFATVCPSPIDAGAWLSRFAQANDRQVALTGQLNLDAVSFDVAHLAASKSDGIASGGANLLATVAARHPWLDFSLAQYLAAFDITSYQATDLVPYVRSYGSVLYYELQARAIANTAGWLYDDLALDRDAFAAVLRGLAGDSNVDVGGKLYAEDLQYQFGVL